MTRLDTPVKEYPLIESEEWMHLTGKLPVSMTNDYLFRALMQSDEVVRNAIIASLLGVPKAEISYSKVENPILLGAAVDDKDFLLDTHVGLIGKALNLEMQVINEGNWPERSMSYLCRLFERQ